MKANVKKEWDQLSPLAQKRITDALVEETYDTLNNELVVAQFNWIRMGAWALHMSGKSSDDVVSWLGAFKRVYQLNSRIETQQELTETLTKKMNEIFGEGGFPEEFMQSFQKIGRSKQ